jgi:hypothetical protein
LTTLAGQLKNAHNVLRSLTHLVDFEVGQTLSNNTMSKINVRDVEVATRLLSADLGPNENSILMTSNQNDLISYGETGVDLAPCFVSGSR